MRLVMVVPFVAAVACRENPVSIRAEAPVVTVDAMADEGADVVDDVATDAWDGGPIPSHTARRARFATEALTVATHGIDGTFELWRDRRLDDARVAKEWFGFAFARTPPPPDFETEPAASAQLILRDAHRRIIESLDLELPVAMMTAVRLGDDVTPYLEIAIDTFSGAGRWGGTTHRFVRVEGGRSRWLDCAETYRCSMSCNFHYDKRPSGGFDLLVWRHEHEPDFIKTVTNFTRREIVGVACKDVVRSEPGWVGEDPKTAILIPGSFPPPRTTASATP